MSRTDALFSLRWSVLEYIYIRSKLVWRRAMRILSSPSNLLLMKTLKDKPDEGWAVVSVSSSVTNIVSFTHSIPGVDPSVGGVSDGAVSDLRCCGF